MYGGKRNYFRISHGKGERTDKIWASQGQCQLFQTMRKDKTIRCYISSIKCSREVKKCKCQPVVLSVDLGYGLSSDHGRVRRRGGLQRGSLWLFRLHRCRSAVTVNSWTVPCHIRAHHGRRRCRQSAGFSFCLLPRLSCQESKVVPYSITSVKLMLVSWQSVRRWLSHKPGDRLPLLSTTPTVIQYVVYWLIGSCIRAFDRY